MNLAGFLRRKSAELVKCKTVDVEVPADSDIVVEGYLKPGELREEGPFGDHTGWYSLADDYPVFHVTAITRKREAIYPTTIVGRPPMEDYWLGGATGRIFLPLMKMQLPEIVDVHMPAEGVFHNIGDRLDPQVLSLPRAEGHVRPVGDGTDGAGEGHRHRG